jgi:hypothetical protein
MKKLAFCLSVWPSLLSPARLPFLSGAARVIELRKATQTPADYMDR